MDNKLIAKQDNTRINKTIPEGNIYQTKLIPRQTYIGPQKLIPEELRKIYRKEGELYWNVIEELKKQEKALKEIDGLVRTSLPSTYLGLAVDKIQNKPYGTTYENTPEIFKDVVDLVSPGASVKTLKVAKPTLSLVKKKTKDYIGDALWKALEKHPNLFGINYAVDPKNPYVKEILLDIENREYFKMLSPEEQLQYKKKIQQILEPLELEYAKKLAYEKREKRLVMGMKALPVVLLGTMGGVKGYEDLKYPWNHSWAQNYYNYVSPQVKRLTGILLPNVIDKQAEQNYLNYVHLDSLSKRFPNMLKIKTLEDYDDDSVIENVTNRLIDLTLNPDSINYAPAFNDFYEEKQGTYRKKKDYKDDDLLTDQNIPISKFKNWFSIKNGNILYGSRESFEDDDYIMPNRISLTNAPTKMTFSGFEDYPISIIDSENEKLIMPLGKYLLYSPSSKLSFLVRSENNNILTDTLKKYPDLIPILLDDGRFSFRAKPNRDVTIKDYKYLGGLPNKDFPVFGVKY